MSLLAFKLTPRDAPLLTFHKELPRSDTLLGSIAWALADLGYDPVETLGLAEEPKVLVSSVFPVWEGTFLFPRPLTPPPKLDWEDKKGYEKAKRLKKVKWIKPEQMEGFLRGQPLPADLGEYPGEKSEEEDSNNGRKEKKRPEPIYSSSERPRVAIPRLGGETNLFYTSVVQLREAWFGVRLRDPSVERKLVAALELLGELGLGGEATYGFGAFEISKVDFPIKEPEEPNFWVSLSLYYPKPSEWKLLRGSSSPLLAYGVETRKGRVARYGGNVFKPPILYFSEGSVFPLLGTPPFGNHVRVEFPSVPHPVYIQGSPLWLFGRTSQ